jgi:transcription antitermination factor NusG
LREATQRARSLGAVDVPILVRRPIDVPAGGLCDPLSRRRRLRGLVELPKPHGLQPGDRIRITQGPFRDRLALYAGQAPHDRVAVLLQLLGAQQRTELSANAVEAVS